MRKRRKQIAAAAVLILLAVIAAGVWYVTDYYHSDEEAQACLQSAGQVTVTECDEGLLLDGAGEETALIFYPGAKVEYTAYLPLLLRLSEQGVDCFLVKMPCNLAVLGQNKADGILAEYEYEKWYLAGHSLGGAMAAAYTAGHSEKISGLILLAAYPTEALTDAALSVLSIYGSEDGVLNRAKLEEGRGQMPERYTELCIEGGNHAYFGNYGEQKGDLPARISREEQQEQTAEAMLQLIMQESAGQSQTEQEEQGRMEYRQITQREARELMEAEEDILILDVRTREEYETGHIKGAVCLPNEEIAGEPELLSDKSQTILVYCRSGRRSREAAQKLADLGYEQILEFGGILDWPYEELVE